MKKTLLNTLLILGIVYGIVFFLATAVGIYDALKSPDFYSALYGMNGYGLHWQFLSFENFFTLESFKLLIYLSYVILNFQCYYKRKPRMINAVILADCLIVLLTIRFYYLLRTSGFDHYPGFDPYFF